MVNVHIYMGKYISVWFSCIWMCVHIEARGRCLVISLIALQLILSDRLSPWICSLLIKLDWLPSKLQGLTQSPPGSLIMGMCCHAYLLYGYWKPKLRSLWVHGMHFSEWAISSALNSCYFFTFYKVPPENFMGLVPVNIQKSRIGTLSHIFCQNRWCSHGQSQNLNLKQTYNLTIAF